MANAVSVTQVLSHLVADRLDYLLVVNPEDASTGVIALAKLLESVRSSIHADIASHQIADSQVQWSREDLKKQFDFSSAVVDAISDGVSACTAIEKAPPVSYTHLDVYKGQPVCSTATLAQMPCSATAFGSDSASEAGPPVGHRSSVGLGFWKSCPFLAHFPDLSQSLAPDASWFGAEAL